MKPLKYALNVNNYPVKPGNHLWVKNYPITTLYSQPNIRKYN